MNTRSYLLVASLGVFSLAGANFGCGEITKAGGDGGLVDAGDVSDGGAGDPDAATGPCSGATVAFDDFYDCAQATACSLFERCLGSFGSFDCLQFPFDGLVGNYARSVGEAFFADAIASGTIVFAPDVAASCLADLLDFACFEIFTDENPFDACGVFQGTVTPGNVCFDDLECMGAGAFCEQPTTCQGSVCCAGTCRAPVPTGGPCPSGEGCRPGDVCSGAICRSGDLGSPCNGDYECDDILWCNAGSCAGDFSSGANCVSDGQCPAPEVCVGRDLSPPQGRCMRADTVGASCEQGGAGCFEGLYCLQPQSTVLGTCQPIPGIGESCAASNFCGPFLSCDDSSVCVDLSGSGKACGTGNLPCNPALFCTSELSGQPTGVCTARQPDAQVCTSSEQCQSGICEGGFCGAYPGCFAGM